MIIFWGKKFYNSLKIGSNFFRQHFKNKIILNFVKFVATKKVWQQIFFTPVFCCCFWIRDPGPGINIPDPQHCLYYCLPLFREGASSRMDAMEADRTSVQAQLLQRMTEALSRMLNDPGALQRDYNIIDKCHWNVLDFAETLSVKNQSFRDKTCLLS